MPAASPSRPAEDAIRFAHGLTVDQAARQLAADGPNELPSARPRTLLDVGVEVVREPMLLLLIATGIVYVLLGDLLEALALVAAIGVVVGISVYQAQKTEHALQALRDLSSPRALVVRDGRTVRIPGRDVVRGDRVILREGDRVPADAVVVETSNLEVDESLLTGESVPVEKAVSPREDALASRSNVYSGTLVVRGAGVAHVIATGIRTELGRIGATLSRVEIGQTSLQIEVRRIVRFLVLAGLIVCGVVAIVDGINRHQWLDGLLAGLTVAISLVPEEFPVVLTVFLALGAWRISRNRVLTRRVPAIETLGAATVLCVDKTGTLTLNRMSVIAIAAGQNAIDVNPGSKTLPSSHRDVVETAILASRRDPFDPMERAFAELGGRLTIAAPQDSWRLVREYPLTERLLAVTQVWETSGSAGYIVATKGAPEAVARLCRLDERNTRELLEQVSSMAARGLRVLGVARSRYVPRALPGSPFDFPFTLLGLVGLQDPVRPGVPGAIAECRSAGIRVVMITGDHAATAVNIARQIGLDNSGAYLTGGDLTTMSDEELRRRVADVNVFARVVPEQKLRLVSALKARGEVVAMTGDGVNDAPALKAAHIGIAMGGRGTDVAREAAALVLLDDDFTSIVGAVRVGRRIYGNITKAMSYVLGVHVPIAGVSMIPVLLGGPLMLMPLHIILLELIIDPACSVAFEREPAESDVMLRPPRNPRQRLFTPLFVVRSLTQGAGAMAATVAVYLGGFRNGLSEADIRTLTFITLILTNLALIVTNRSLTLSVVGQWRTPNRMLAVIGVGALAVLAAVVVVPVLRDLFRLAVPDAGDLLVVAGAGLASLVWMEMVKRIAATARGPEAGW
jgi:Ca2+-transporting ATPase